MQIYIIMMVKYYNNINAIFREEPTVIGQK